ncbi:MAG: hypothetical protein SynsKO_21720 [Synoicihabitans sp.]
MRGGVLQSLVDRHSPLKITLVATLIAIIGSLAVTYVFISIVGMDQMNEYFAAAIAALCPAIVAPPMIYAQCKTMRKIAEQKQQLTLANGQLQSAVDQVQELSGMLPLCAWCHKVRDDSGYWEKVEAFIERNMQTMITHGVCPDCQSRELSKLGPTVTKI